MWTIKMNCIEPSKIDINNLQIAFEHDEIYWETKFWGPREITLQLGAKRVELENLGLKVPEDYTSLDIYNSDANFQIILTFSQKAILLEIRRQMEEAEKLLEEFKQFKPESAILHF